MPTIPESPRRQTMGGGGNPVKNDPALIMLMERLDLVDSYATFQNWKTEFLLRFETFLGDSGSDQALQAYEDFRNRIMEQVVKKVKRLSYYRVNGNLSVESVSVRARNAMNEVSVVLIDAAKTCRGLVPPTSADEDKAGYNKYNLGAVLVRDGFQEYERLQKCKDTMDNLRGECIEEIGDEKLLDAIKKYDDEVNRFVSIMEDLGLYKIVQKSREFDPNETPQPPAEPTAEPAIPVLPFDAKGEDQLEDIEPVDAKREEKSEENEPVDEAQEEPVEEEVKIVEEPVELSPLKPEEQPESAPEPKAETEGKTGKKEKRASRSRDGYNVKGSWGMMPKFFGGKSKSKSKTKVQQDLASPAPKSVSPKKTRKQPDQVFVTPARTATPLPQIDILNNIGTLPEPVTSDQTTGEVEETNEGSIRDISDSSMNESTNGSMENSRMGSSMNMSVSDVAETPRTRKAKLEWKSVKSKSKRPSAIPNKTGSGEQQRKSDKKKIPKAPKPPISKSLKTKTEDSDWNLPMSEDADASSVWSRSRTPTAKESDNDATIGPGVKVRRVSKQRTKDGSSKSPSKRSKRKSSSLPLHASGMPPAPVDLEANIQSLTDKSEKLDSNDSGKRDSIDVDRTSNDVTNIGAYPAEEPANETEKAVATKETDQTNTETDGKLYDSQNRSHVHGTLEQEEVDPANDLQAIRPAGSEPPINEPIVDKMSREETDKLPDVTTKEPTELEINEELADRMDKKESPSTPTANIVKSPVKVADDASPLLVQDLAPKDTTIDDSILHNHNQPAVVVTPSKTGVDWIESVVKEPVTQTIVGINRAGYTDPTIKRSTYIRLMTFCSVDDSCDPRLLGILAQCYPMIEFAVLMRPDMAGEARYASPQWVQRLATVQTKMGGTMNLASHLCGSLVDEILDGNDSMIRRLRDMKFRRVQLNTTSINGVRTFELTKRVDAFIDIAKKFPDIEFTLQKNTETDAFCGAVLASGAVPENISFLLDESMGRGQIPDEWENAPRGVRIGYAGGIGLGGRGMTKRILKDILGMKGNGAVWISMESSLRCTKNGKDCFDINKCYEILDVAQECNVHLHPEFVH